MNKLFLYNEDRYIHIVIGDIHLTYLGPIGLISFKKIINMSGGVITALTEYDDEIAEDYVDVRHELNLYNYDSDAILSSIKELVIGKPFSNPQGRKNHKTTMKTSKSQIIANSLLVSDNFGLSYEHTSSGDFIIKAENLSRPNACAIVSLNDNRLIQTNMTSSMLKRVLATVSRNKDLLIEEINERESVNA